MERRERDPHNTVRFGVAEAPVRSDRRQKASVPGLIEVLRQDTGGGARPEAATALGLIGDLGALPALTEALNNPDNDVPKAAAEAIERPGDAAETRRPPR
jgi:HEAT repeat protein